MSSTVSGTIASDQTWSGEVFASGPVYVPEGVTLTILPGTTVRFTAIEDYRGEQIAMELDGRLLAEGTAEQPIWFTSAAVQPRNGDWAMLRLNGNTDSRIDYAIIEFAQQGINLWGSDVTITNTVVRWNNWEGIYLENQSTATIENSLIYQNGYNGVAMEQFNNVTLRNNIIENNGSHGIHVDASTALLEGNIVSRNGFSGISVDNDAVLIARDNATTDNKDQGFTFGEGQFDLTLSGNSLSGNVEGGGLSSSLQNQNGQGNGPSDITSVRALDRRPYELGYTPSDQQLDTYPYVFPDSSSRTIEHVFGQELGLTWSLAVDGDTLWTSTLSGAIYQLDASNGEVLKTLTAPSVQPWGMTHDGENLWITDFAEKRTYKIDTESGEELFSFDNPAQDAGAKGLAWDGSHLYIMGWGDQTIYRVTTQGELLSTIVLQGDGGGGLTWDGNSFWVPAGKKLVQYSAEGQQLREIYGGSEGNWDLAWDASRELLWASQRSNENWFDVGRIFGLRVYEQVDGSNGIDRVQFSGASTDYSLRTIDGAMLVSDSNAGRDGAKSLNSIERLEFADLGKAFDLDGHAGMVAKTLGSVAGAAALSNGSYVSLGLQLLDDGLSYEGLMQLAIDALLGNRADNNEAVVELLFSNVAGRSPTAAEVEEFVGLLNDGIYTPSSLGVLAAESDINASNIDLIGLAEKGLDYIL